MDINSGHSTVNSLNSSTPFLWFAFFLSEMYIATLFLAQHFWPYYILWTVDIHPISVLPASNLSIWPISKWQAMRNWLRSKWDHLPFTFKSAVGELPCKLIIYNSIFFLSLKRKPTFPWLHTSLILLSSGRVGKASLFITHIVFHGTREGKMFNILVYIPWL